MYYTLKDHQGSLAAVVHGNTVERLSYDAWGNLRNPNTWSGSFNDMPLFDRGFTGHEHLYNFGLINMNGRMYDPVVSSFLSVDQYVQSPDNAQGFNRYTYCMNNPLRYIDPSGWRAGGGNTGYFPNSSANAFDPYAFYGGHNPLEPRDLGLRQLDTSDPIIVWMEENSLHGSGNGPKGGGFYVNLASGLIEHHEGQNNNDFLKQGLIFLADDEASIGDIEAVLEQKGLTYKKDPRVSGGYIVDTEKAYHGWQLWKSMPLFAAYFSGMMAEEIFLYLSLIPTKEVKYTVKAQKYEYFFGKVNSNNHNTARSIQNAKDLKLLGITKKSRLNKIFEQAITEGEVVSTQTGVYGTTVMRRVNIGQYGCIDVGFFYLSNSILTTPNVVTIIPKIYKP